MNIQQAAKTAGAPANTASRSAHATVRAKPRTGQSERTPGGHDRNILIAGIEIGIRQPASFTSKIHHFTTTRTTQEL